MASGRNIWCLGGSGVAAEVAVAEPTGSETQVFAKLGRQKLVGMFRERIGARMGEALPIAPQLDAVHLFDEGTGNRLN